MGEQINKKTYFQTELTSEAGRLHVCPSPLPVTFLKLSFFWPFYQPLISDWPLNATSHQTCQLGGQYSAPDIGLSLLLSGSFILSVLSWGHPFRSRVLNWH